MNAPHATAPHATPETTDRSDDPPAARPHAAGPHASRSRVARLWRLASRGSGQPSPPLLGFSGRVAPRHYMALQLVSALLFISAIVFAVLSVTMGKAIVIDDFAYFIMADWAIAGGVATMVASLVIGAGAVTRRARDGALPAIFIGLFYVINRLLLPVNIGALGPPDVRDIALQFAGIMFVVQLLLLVRGTMPDPAPLRLWRRR